MIQLTQADTLRREKAVRQRSEMLRKVTNPDPDKLTDKKFLQDLLPSGWKECVYEYDNKYFITISIGQAMTKTEEFSITNLIAKELGKENIILPNMTRNTLLSSSINVQLKKSNYEGEIAV